MSSLTRWGARALLILAALVLLAATARADNIRIDDLTDTLTVTADQNPENIKILPDSTGEFLHFDWTSRLPAAATESASGFLVDPPGTDDAVGSNSDKLQLQLTQGSNIVEVKFGSDPYLSFIANGDINRGSQFENGKFHLMAQTVVVGTGQVVDSYYARSDIVPEPASLTLLGLGVLGLGGYALRRRKPAKG